MFEEDCDNSSEWADHLCQIDNGGTAPLLLVEKKVAKVKRGRKEEEEETRGAEKGKEREGGEERVVKKASFPPPSQFTSEIRAEIAKICRLSTNQSEKLVQQVSPSTFHLLQNCCLLIAYADDDDASKTLKESIVSVACRMDRLNRVEKRPNLQISIAMYDVNAPGNRTFAREKLQANSNSRKEEEEERVFEKESNLPKLFFCNPFQNAIVPWKGLLTKTLKKEGSKQGVEKKKGGGTQGWNVTFAEDAIIEELLRCKADNDLAN